MSAFTEDLPPEVEHEPLDSGEESEDWAKSAPKPSNNVRSRDDSDPRQIDPLTQPRLYGMDLDEKNGTETWLLHQSGMDPLNPTLSKEQLALATAAALASANGPSVMEIDVTDVTPPLPPDGGWGWMIVFGSFITMALVDGMCYSYGIFISDLEAEFATSKTKLSLAGSLLTGCYLFMGPIAGALSNQFGAQSMMYVGTIISCVTIFLSAFVYNFDLFILLFGIFGGIGFGLVFLPASTLVPIWFHKRRATANGISLCGSGVGNAIYGVLVPILIRNYTWRGCIILLAGLTFNCAVAGALFRPLTPEDYKQNHKEDDKNANKKPGSFKKKSDAVKSSIEKWRRKRMQQKARQCSAFDATLRTKEHHRALSTGSLNGKIISIDNQVLALPTDYPDRPILSTEVINQIVLNHLMAKERGNESRSNLHASSRLRGAGSIIHSQRSIAQQHVVEPARGTRTFTAPNSHFASTVSLSPAVNMGHIIDDETKTEIVEKLRQEVSRPMNKKDILYSGSMMHLNEYLSHTDDVKSYVKSVTNVVSGEEGNAVIAALSKMFDIDILKSPTFILLVISSIFSMLGFFIPFQFLKDYAEKQGNSAEYSSYLLSIIGITNTIGRILFGFISDQPWADCLLVTNIALIICGVATMALPFCTTYFLLTSYAATFGLFISAFASLRQILVVEFIGLNRLTNAYGFLLLFMGFAVVTGPPLLGSFYDALKVYDYTFYLGGFSLVFSAIICFPLRKLSEWEANRKKGKGREEVRGIEIPSLP